VGGFWPLNEVAKQIEVQIDTLGQPLKPFIEKFDELLDQGNRAMEGLSADQIKKAQDELNQSFSTEGRQRLSNWHLVLHR